MNGRVFHLVPTIERPLNALADYAALLASSCEGQSSLLTLPGKNLPAEHLGVEVLPLPDSLELRLPPDSVLVLHYEGYGYSRKGYPQWLLSSLLERTPPSLQLITIIHEAYASGPWYTSAFWLSRLQKKLTRSICDLSRSVVVTREQNLHLLGAANPPPNFNIRCAPVFSCVGEPSSIARGSRAPEIVVFGTPGRRLGVYEDTECFARIANLLSIERIVDIGEPFPSLPTSVGGIPVTKKGWCSQKEIQETLSTAKFGAIDYPADILAKSSIFGAYSSFGLVTLVKSKHPQREIDNLRPGREYLLWSEIEPEDDMQQIATSAYNWYQPHSLAKQAALLQHDIDSCFGTKETPR